MPMEVPSLDEFDLPSLAHSAARLGRSASGVRPAPGSWTRSESRFTRLHGRPDARRLRTQTNAEGGQARTFCAFVDAPGPTGAAPASQAAHGVTVGLVESSTARP